MITTSRRFLRTLGSALAGTRLPRAVSAAITGRPRVHQFASALDELDIALVAVDSADHWAVVNRAAASMLDLPVGHMEAREFAAVLKGLATRALNQSEVHPLMESVHNDRMAAFSSTWVFADTPTYLGVASKPAKYPGFDGRIWAFYDNSHVARAVDGDRQADALIRASSDSMIDPQVILEGVWQDGRVVDLIHRDINQAGCDYFAMTREQFIGKSLIDKGLMDVYARCAETGEPVILDASPYQSEFLGEMRYYDVRGTRVRPGMIVVTWRDVTDRIDSARLVAASEEQFRLLAENVGDVVVRLTDEGVITWVSNSVEQVLGAPAETWIGGSIIDYALPADREATRRRWAEIADGKPYIGRRRLRDVSGSMHWVHLHSKPFFDAGGERDGLVASFRVIDDEVAAETAARDAIARRDERNRRLAGYLKAQTTRLMYELNSAATYVASILPDDLDGRVAVMSRYLPSEELGGDTYDFRWIDEDHLAVYLVDVSGHGVGPALLSVSVHNLLRSGSVKNKTLLRPDATLTALNRLFPMERQGGRYFTIWYGVYQASTRTLRFASAGHPPALVAAGGAVPEQLNTESMPVGILEDSVFEARTYVVPPAAEILLYSDGALELGMPEGRQRSLADFSAAYAQSSGKPEWTLNTLIVTLQENSAPAKVTDDSTFVLLSIP